MSRLEDDLELYGDIDNEDLVDPDLPPTSNNNTSSSTQPNQINAPGVQAGTKEETDERDEGAVADVLGEDGTDENPAPIPTFQTLTNSHPGPSHSQAQNYGGYSHNQQGQGQGQGQQGQGQQVQGYGHGQNQNQGRGQGYQGQGGYESYNRENEEGKMFIGGLNWETNDANLHTYFSQFGTVASSSIMRDPTGRSRGFAFLTFEDPSSVNAVMAKEHILDGKMIDPKRAIPRAEHVKSSKIFVGGLAPSVTNASLKTFFTEFGNVMDAHVMFDRETNRNKGFGFVTFEDEESVERAMGATGMELDGKTIEVKRAQPKHSRDLGDPSSRRHIGSYMAEGAQSGKYNHNLPPNGTGGMMPGMGAMAGMGGMGGMNGMQGMGAMGQGGFDPQAMAMMYQRMMMSMMGGGMNPMMNMGMMGQNRMASPQGQANPMMGMNMGGGAYNPMMMMNRMTSPSGSAQTPSAGGGNATAPTPAATVPGNAPRGPAAMRPPPAGPSGGGQPARYSTQGQARSRPY